MGQSVRLPHEEAKLGTEPQSPAWYEVQVRNVCSPMPQFVLRTLRDLLPSLVWHQKEVATGTSSTMPGTSSIKELWQTAANRTHERERSASIVDQIYVSPYPAYMVESTP